MKNTLRLLILSLAFLNLLCKIEPINSIKSNLNAEAMHEINEEVNSDYRKAEFEFELTDSYQYFKYENDTLPEAGVSTFRIDFDQYSYLMQDYQVLCTNVPSATTDEELINILKGLALTQSSCIDGFRSYAIYDGIVKLDKTKPKLGIVLISKAEYAFAGRIFFRTTERVLGTDESKPMEEETYSLVPFTVNIAKFRELSKSKILFYSYSRTLQMLHSGTSTPYPEKLFSGNILSVYTNPNMVRQKYHNANLMVLITLPFVNSNLGETFKFEVKLFDSNFLLDYYVSSNTEGRPVNSPLLINMTECTNPYYVILNYNQAESAKTLILDQIYGKLYSLSVATKLTQSTWDEMIKNDMEMIDITALKHDLPGGSSSHIDVYKIECDLPLMFNFYYVDENELTPKMNYGDIHIFTLKPYETVNIPFFEDIIAPSVIVEIYNPENEPIVIIDATEETVYQKNTLVKLTPMNLKEGINIKERAGLSETRIIIKVGYPNSGWKDTADKYIKYNEAYQTYLFEFPNDASRYNYTFANLITSGTNEEDNVKYCFTTNIGAALKPSSENCYRVADANPYTLKTYNPLIMYKDYEYDVGLSYYVTFKPVTSFSKFEVKAEVNRYDTTERNYEGINNKIVIDSTGDYSSILTPPARKDPAIFLQIQVCDDVNSIKAKIIKPLTGEVLVPEEEIKAGLKNQYKTFKNDLIDTEYFVTGKEGTEVFIRMVGLPTIYVPSFNNNYQITFDDKTNTLNVESPITKTESMKYTVLVDKEGVISQKGFTLCSFVDQKIETLAAFTKSVVTQNKVASLQINFVKAGIQSGEKFEAIVYIEQQTKSQMVFLSSVFQGTAGTITIDSIYEINEEYSADTNYAYKTVLGKSTDMNYYFSYLHTNILKIPFGAFGIELEQDATGSFTDVACTFVDADTDALSMIEAVEKAIEDGTSSCTGSQSRVNSKRYNYIFKYQYKDETTPKKMVIKIANGNKVNGNFNVYVKKDQGVTVEHTDFTTLKEYGQDEETKKSVIPYIVDVNTLRGTSDTDYVSKVLFFSQHLEMQMYYIAEDSNVPIKLFSGNIALVYTKPDLAIQKYHSTTLVLISENLEGQEHAALGDTFRFHTKMFKSDAQIEYFMSQNPDGRTLNFPLSLEMNICSKDNNKLYYILNYNKAEPERTLHLDMIFGAYLNARIAREINAQTWDSLISNSMTNIENYQIDLPEKSQHIDVIEIECKSQLLINAYYTYDDYSYTNVKKGEIVVKELPSLDSFKFSLNRDDISLFYYTISLFNPTETPSVIVRFADGNEHYISENSIQTGFLMTTPETITVINNCKSQTRFILKIGFDVESQGDWSKVEPDKPIDGTLFANRNKYVYKFPVGDNKRNFTSVNFVVKSINEIENTKFCYSTNLGTAIEASKENCFRTGKNIPYTLTFINPLIVGRNYKVETDRYYISFRPFEDTDFISLSIEEEKYGISNRNIEGVAKLLTLSTRVATILSLPEKETSKILFQLKTCKESTDPIVYKLSNAYTHEELHSGKVYYRDKFGVYYITDNAYLENGLELTGESVPVFTKHAAVGEYSPVIIDYQTTFDSSTNTASIIKPIYNEEFTITVIVGEKGSLSGLTQCDLAFNDKKKYGKYSNTFISVSSNLITHFIDFESFGFSENTEFDLLVYAEQTGNSKMEFLYPVITGKVGKVTGVQEINEYVEGQNEYMNKTFIYSSSSNYLYFDFKNAQEPPNGKIASLKIRTDAAKVSKVGCVFVPNTATEAEMVNIVNSAVLNGKSVCLGEMQKDTDGYDALINANYAPNNNRLVIQVIYGLGNEKEEQLKDENKNVNIVIKVAGTNLGIDEFKVSNPENLATIPYVIDLLKIRDSKDEYVSKILFYSNTREMEMFYIDENEPAPVSLFTGNIMLVYTNEELVRQKYHGATKMILITDSLSSTERAIIGETYRYTVKYFNSAAQIQYYVSSNPDGRPLNNPTAIEMTSCDQPYYYILNYNHLEEQRTLHIDTIFGEVNSTKLAYELNQGDWDSLVSEMKEFKGNQIVLEEQNRFHFDVLEVKCNLPLLLNIYYVNPQETKLTNLEIGDITILSLLRGQSQTLKFKTGEKGPYAYSFNVFKEYGNPNIQLTFSDKSTLNITENGVYPKYSLYEFESIIIDNKDNAGTSTKIIFKFGYVIEYNFLKIENRIYTNQNDENRDINLFGYMYETTSSRFNYTGVDFEVQTTEDNVKFCYSTNIGTYINPSLQNCYRVGKNNPYTISTLNPYVMFKNYHYDDLINYYVGFRTVELNQNITIVPKLKKYDTTERNHEGARNKIKISGENSYSTILTAPKKNEPYIFTHIHVCTKNKPLSYEFLNAYNSVNLGYNGEIVANSKNNFITIDNTKLDTELKLNGDNGVEVFVKHVGIPEKKQIIVRDIKFGYNKDTHVLNWTQPIEDEEFQYTIYIDKLDNIKKQGYTLCSITEVTKLAHYSEILTTNSNNPSIQIDFTKPELQGYDDFDVIIVADQINNGKLTILSPVYNSNGESSEGGGEEGGESVEPSNESSSTGLIVLIVILAVALIGGGIAAFILFYQYKKKGEVSRGNKATSLALIKSQQDGKLVESQAQEPNQIDP